jgi:hypothetical protein
MTTPTLPLPKIGDRIRLAIQHQGVWRPLLWIRAGKDGSLYVGMLLDSPTSALHGGATPVGGEVDVRYSEAQPLTPIPSSSRVSFTHGLG